MYTLKVQEHMATGELANRFAKQSYRNTGQGGLRGFISGGGIFGNLLRGVGQKFGFGKKYNQPTYDMSEFSNYGIGGTPPGTLDEDEDEKISETSFTANDPNNINNQGIINTNAFNDSNANNMSVEELNSWVGGS